MNDTIDDLPAAATTPILATDWMDSLPADWSGWLDLCGRVNRNLESRGNFRDWMSAHLSPGADGRKLGMGFCAAGDPERALPYLKPCDDDLCQALQGRALADTQQPARAIEVWKGLTGSPAVGIRVLLWLLESSVREDSEEDAALLQRLKDAGADAADLAYAEGLVAERAGDHPGATASWRVAVQHDPRHADALFHLALRLDLDGHDHEAMAVYTRFTETDMEPHAGALMNLGVLHEDREDFSAAAGCYRLVAAAHPTDVRARRYLVEAEAGIDQFYDETREKRADRQSAVLRIPVTDFELSVRARNCLQRMNLHVLGDLVCRTESELLAFKNFGETSLQEVQDILASKGLRLGMMAAGEWNPSPLPAAGAEPAPSGETTDQSILALDLSVRSRAALAALGIKTVGELTRTGVATLLSCRNFGQTSLDELRSKLASLGLTLAS